jgi:Tfp pilus assembly protein PilO
MGPDGKLARALTAFWTALHDPIKLRAFLCTSFIVIWYGSAYGPLAGMTEETLQAQEREKKHLSLARDIEALRDQVKRFQGRLPSNTDPNEWVEYVLTAIRKHTVKLVTLDPQGTRQHGPYSLVVLRIELEGAYPDLEKMLYWIETNERIFRVESVRIDQSRAGKGILLMSLLVLGVMG